VLEEEKNEIPFACLMMRIKHETIIRGFTNQTNKKETYIAKKKTIFCVDFIEQRWL
jgi:hypothetical protein